MGDRGAEGPDSAALDVDVDPLVVEGRVGEGVDAGLVDREPLAGADLGPGGRGDVVERGEGAHGPTLGPASSAPRWRGLVGWGRERRDTGPHPHPDAPHPRAGARRPQGPAPRPPRRRAATADDRRGLAAEIGHELPAPDAESLGRWFADSADSGSLVRYLETFDHTVAVMQHGPAIARVARESVEDLAADGVVYAEVRYAPEQHVTGGMTLDEVVAAVQEGFDAGMAAAGGRIVVRQLLTAMRHQSPVEGDRRASPSPGATAGSRASTSRAPRPASRPPATSTPSSTSSARTPTSPSTRARPSACPRSGRPCQWCGADRLGHGVRIADDITVDEDGSVRPSAAWRRTCATSASRSRCAPAPTSRRGGQVDRRAPDRPAAPASFRVTVNTDNRLMSAPR